MDLTALNTISYGVYIVGAKEGEKLAGCVINTAMQITADPPVLAISLNHENYTHSVIENTGRFSLSVLSEQTPPALIPIFGFRCSKDYDKFSACPYELVDGLPVIREKTCASFVCKVVGKYDAGTHTIFLGQVEQAQKNESLPQMTYEYYHKVIKGKEPAKAPTYRKEEKENKPASGENNYVCTVCGYVHEGSLDNEPDDYVCPLCGVPKSAFKPQ